MVMKRIIYYLLLIVGALVLINLFLVPVMEPTMIYLPTRGMGANPRSIGLPYEDVFVTCKDDVKINGWFVENKAADKVILLFHGNGGNISYRLPLISLLYRLPASIFIIDYHGYGKSEGKPAEKNLYLDADAAYNYLIEVKEYQPDQIIVMGSSLGGAVATYLAEKEKVGGLVLLRSFTSARDMAQLTMPLYRRPFIWIRSKFDSLERINKISAPKLIVHSKKDETIPYTMSEALYGKAADPKQLILLEEGSHNDLIVAKRYISALRRIVK